MESSEEIVFGKFIGKIISSLMSGKKLEDYYKEVGRVIWKGEMVKGGLKILDGGVGPLAGYTLSFAEAGATVTALDLSRTSLLGAKRRINERKQNERVDFVQADIRNLPFKKGVFDITFCRGTIFHLPLMKNVEISLKEMGRVVNKRGYIYFDAESYINPMNWPKVVITKFLQNLRILGHPHLFFSYPLLVNIIKRANLKIVDIDTNFSLDTPLFLIPLFFSQQSKITKIWNCIEKMLNKKAEKNMFLKAMGFHWYVKTKVS